MTSARYSSPRKNAIFKTLGIIIIRNYCKVLVLVISQHVTVLPLMLYITHLHDEHISKIIIPISMKREPFCGYFNRNYLLHWIVFTEPLPFLSKMKNTENWDTFGRGKGVRGHTNDQKF